MRKFAIRSTKPKEGGESRQSNGDKGFLKKHWCLISLLVIIALAFIIRFVWSYGISAGDSYALSGGSDATGHLNVVESILNGSFSLTDSALNYPYGSLNVVPPLVDFIAAGVAGIGTLCGVSTSVAAAGALAWLAPIFGVLTCIPVFLVAKKMFDDEKVAVIATALYAFFAILVMNTVFSNGTEFAFVGFVFAWMVYFLYSAVATIDEASPTLGSFKSKPILLNTLVAGVCFALIALAWNKFEIIVTMMAVFIIFQAIVDRIRGVEKLTLTTMVYSASLMIGLLISALFYIPAGLWDTVFSGPFLRGIIVVALALFFCFTSKKSWVIMLPVTIVIGIVVMGVIFFTMPDTFSAILGGNNIYEGSLMQALVTHSVTSISAMAAYFGWVVLWLPAVLFLYMVYRYRKNIDSRAYTFIMLWVICSFCVTWYSYNYATIASVAIAIGAAAVIMKMIRASNFKDYFHSLRGNGFMSGAKKAIKPVPLFTLVVLVGLIIAPNALYAVDAAIPTNAEDSNDYFGGLGYTISTEDSSLVSEFWNDYSDEEKSGALATWFGYSNEAVAYGNFSSITDVRGGGASAASNMLTSSGSSATLSAMAIRLMMSGDISDYQSAITSAGLSYGEISGYFNDPSTAVDEIIGNPTEYPGIDVDVTDENAVYLTVEHYISENLSEPEIADFYNDVCSISGNKISYVMVNGSMIPMYYGDNSYFPTIAYFSDYVVDAYGAPEEFFSYNTSTGYAEYTDAMYETFFWKSLIGITESDAGYTSTISFLSALALSDGTLKAVPGYGLSNYKVAYWSVQYNADKDAELSSDGWEYMDAYEAIELQNTQGGMINYLSSLVLMEYSETGYNTTSGTIQYTSATGAAPAQGIQVAVFEKTNYDSSGVTSYVQRCTTYTDSEGRYSVSVPTAAVADDYYIVFSSGTTTMTGGTVIATFTGAVDPVYTMGATSISGNIVSSEDKAYVENVYVTITGIASGMTYQSDATGGAFSFTNIVPDKYTATVYKEDGSTVTASTIIACVGDNVGAQIIIGSATITVTVNNEYGAAVDDGMIIATNTTTGNYVSAYVENGTATLVVAAPASTTYSLSATSGIVSLSATEVSVTKDGTKTATMVVSDSSRTISISGASGTVSLMSAGFKATSTGSSVTVPTSGGPNNTVYTAYSVSGDRVYIGSTSGTSISMTSYLGYNVTGTLTDHDGNATDGTIVFITNAGDKIYVSADAGGKYSIMLPSGDYAVWAYDSSDSAYLGTKTITGSTTYDIAMDEGRTLSATLTYRTQMSSSSTKGVSYFDISLTATVGGVDYSLVLQTNNSGKVSFYVPVNCTCKVSADAMDTTTFYMESQSTTFDTGTSDNSISWTIAASKTDDATKYVKEVSVTSSYPVHLVQYSDSSVLYDVQSSTSVEPGQYTATVLGSTGYYFNGTIYVYPGTNGALVMTPIQVSTVTLTKGVQDEITITALENDDEEVGEYHVDSSDDSKYYMENGYSYLLKATSGSTSTIQAAYGYIANLSGSRTVDLTDKTEEITVSGYVGIAADGTLTVTYSGVTLTFDITDGAYEAKLVAGKAMTFIADVSQTISSQVYNYSATKAIAADDLEDEMELNFYVSTSAVEPEVAELSGSNFNFANGTGSFTLSVKNTGTVATTYVITPGSAWVLDKTYMLTVAAGATGTVAVSGTYNPSDVGAGNVGLSVIVTDITENAVGTYVIDTSSMPSYGTATPVYVDVAGADDATVDAVNSYEYMYAVTITNDNNYLKTATLNVTYSGDAWLLMISDGNGGWMKSNGSAFDVIGYDKTVIYVKLMNVGDSTGTIAPSVRITVTLNDGTVATDSASVSVSGRIATMSLTASTADIEVTDMTASGDNIFMDSSKIPTTFWALLALCVLALLAILWMGMKRGVFVRKK